MVAKIATMKVDLWAVPVGTDMPSSAHKVGTGEVPIYGTLNGGHIELSVQPDEQS